MSSSSRGSLPHFTMAATGASGDTHAIFHLVRGPPIDGGRQILSAQGRAGEADLHTQSNRPPGAF